MANSEESTSHNFKVVLLGEGCVGKTSLVLRYVENKFNDKHISTVQASFLVKKLNIGGKRINLTIWDTAGQEKFHALGPIYYRGSNGAILVYDITDKNSFQKVKSWVKELRKILGAEICLVIAGNKTDLEKERNVTIEEAETLVCGLETCRTLLRCLRHVSSPETKLSWTLDAEAYDLDKWTFYANQVGATHCHTSAKHNQGIEDMFLTLTQKMIEQAAKQEQLNSSSLNRQNSQRRNVLVVDDDQVEAPTKHCCGNS